MAGGKAVPLDPVKASCKGGDAKDCAILRDYYREAGKQEEVTRLKAELCGANKSSISCAQDWEWQEEGMEYGF